MKYWFLCVIFSTATAAAATDPQLKALSEQVEKTDPQCKALRKELGDLKKQTSGDTITDPSLALQLLDKVERASGVEEALHRMVALLYRKGSSATEDDFSLLWQKHCNVLVGMYTSLRNLINSSPKLDLTIEQKTRLTKLVLKRIDYETDSPGTLMTFLTSINLFDKLVNAKLITLDAAHANNLATVMKEGIQLRDDAEQRHKAEGNDFSKTAGKAFLELPPDLQHKMMSDFRGELDRMEPIRTQFRVLLKSVQIPG